MSIMQWNIVGDNRFCFQEVHKAPVYHVYSTLHHDSGTLTVTGRGSTSSLAWRPPQDRYAVRSRQTFWLVETQTPVTSSSTDWCLDQTESSTRAIKECWHWTEQAGLEKLVVSWKPGLLLSEATSSPTCQTEAFQDVHREQAAAKHIPECFHVPFPGSCSSFLRWIRAIFAANSQPSPQESVHIYFMS